MALRALFPDDPTEVGPYRLTGRLGAGGMGVVYLGFDADGQPVAVKTLKVGAEPEARLRLCREAEHMAVVDDPRVARLLACDTDTDVPWIASTYIAGPALSEVKLPLPDMSLRALAEGLAGALQALAAAGIVHRDVKPGNVILSFDGPVLVDLGISRTGTATALTQAGTVLGSPVWMPPEQLRGERTAAATDVWAWGAVLAYAATGRLPFGEGSLEAVAWRVQTAEPELAGLPEWLEGPVRAALQKKPADRPPASRLLAAAASPGSAAGMPGAARVWRAGEAVPSEAGGGAGEPAPAAGPWPPAVPVAVWPAPAASSPPAPVPVPPGGAGGWPYAPAPLPPEAPAPVAVDALPRVAPDAPARVPSVSAWAHVPPPQLLPAGGARSGPPAERHAFPSRPQNPAAPASPVAGPAPLPPASGMTGGSALHRRWMLRLTRWFFLVLTILVMASLLGSVEVLAGRPVAALLVSAAAVGFVFWLRRFLVRMVIFALCAAALAGAVWLVVVNL